MTAPQEVRLARHAGDLDEEGHDNHIPPLADDGDMLYLDATNVATVGEGAAASASGTLGGYTVASIIDENDATVWHPNSGLSGQWAAVGLSEERLIAGWRIVISTSSHEIPASWILEWSTPEGVWTTVDTVAGGAGGDKGYRALSPPVAARTWRIRQSGTVDFDAAVFTLDLYVSALAATPSEDYGRSLLDTTDAADARALLGISGTPAPSTADYLVGTAQAGLSAEIVVGTTPGGELGGTWPSPTVDTTHSGSSHAATQAAAEATAAAALAAHVAAGGGMDHEHIDAIAFSGDGSTTVYELPAAPFDEFSVKAHVAGLRTAVTLSGYMLTTMTFGSAPASGTDNVLVDIVAAVV
jgi:hypothetical protein